MDDVALASGSAIFLAGGTFGADGAAALTSGSARPLVSGAGPVVASDLTAFRLGLNTFFTVSMATSSNGLRVRLLAAFLVASAAGAGGSSGLRSARARSALAETLETSDFSGFDAVFFIMTADPWLAYALPMCILDQPGAARNSIIALIIFTYFPPIDAGCISFFDR
jgi:hypothetical protein